MRFIRDIISEKRAGRQDAPPPMEDMRTPLAEARAPLAEARAPRLFANTPALGQYALTLGVKPDPLVLSQQAVARQADNVFAADDQREVDLIPAAAPYAAPAPSGHADHQTLRADLMALDVSADAAGDAGGDKHFAADESGDDSQFPAFGADVQTGAPLQTAAMSHWQDHGAAWPAPAFATHPAAVDQARVLDLGEMPYVAVHQPDQPDGMINDAGVQVPPPAAGRGSNRSGRVKTRLLGFNPQSSAVDNPFDKQASRKDAMFPVGWAVVVAGPGRGTAFALRDGVSKVGRGEDQTISINFGDNSISRENHVSIAFDAEQNAFFIGQSGRANIVRLNNKPLLSTEQLRSGDHIRIGETTLRLAVLCGDGFSWGEQA